MFNELTEALKAEDIAATVAVDHAQDVHDAMSEQEEVEELATVFDELDDADVYDEDLNAEVNAASDLADIEDEDDNDFDSDDILEESGGVIETIQYLFVTGILFPSRPIPIPQGASFI